MLDEIWDEGDNPTQVILIHGYIGCLNIMMQWL